MVWLQNKLKANERRIIASLKSYQHTKRIQCLVKVAMLIAATTTIA